MSSRICLMSAVLLLLAGTATARYYENNAYSDADCEDLVTRTIIDGVFGQLLTLEEFGVCANLTSLNEDNYASSMHECVDNEVTLGWYAGDSCSGDAYASTTTSNDCTDMQITSCTDESEFTMLSDWVASATFYSDEDCSTASGVTGEYTQAEVLTAAGGEACGEGADSSYTTLRCIDGAIADVYYSSSDTTCSDDFISAYVVTTNCITSIFDDGDYMIVTCATDFDGASSLPAARGGAAFAWSVAADAAATVLAAVFS